MALLDADSEESQRSTERSHEFPALLAQELAEMFALSLNEADRNHSELLMSRVHEYFNLHQGLLNAEPDRQELASGNAIGRYLLRSWLQRERTRKMACAFFDRQTLSDFDKSIVQKYTDRSISAPSRQVIIAGHSHAPRLKQLDNEVVYINCGTWTRVMNPGQEDLRNRKSLEKALDQLLSNTFPMNTEATWVEVNCEGATLHDLQA